MFSGKLPFETDEEYERRVNEGGPPFLPADFISRVRGGERPPMPSNELSRRRGLTCEMEVLIRDCWNQDPTKRPFAETVVERLRVLSSQPVDESPLDKMAASFHRQMLQSQADNPLVVLMNQTLG